MNKKEAGMAPRVRAPGKEWLTDRISEGLSDQEMSDRWFEESGERLSRQGINRVVRLYDLRPRLERFDDMIPWTVKAEHAGHWYHRLLYVAARLRRGLPVEDKWRKSWENFKEDHLDAEGMVIAYLPDSPEGFYLTPARDGEEIITLRGRE